MTPNIQTMLFAGAATIAGNVVAAFIIWRVMEWRKTRRWQAMLAPAAISAWIAVILYLAFTPPSSDRLTFWVMVAGSAIGALLSARLIFGVIRYTKAETALGDDPQYRGAVPDLLVFAVALAPVLAAAFLF